MLLFLIGCFQVDGEEWEAWENKNTEPAEEEIPENEAPVVSEVEITPNETVYNDELLFCTSTAEDPEGQVVTLSYVWKNNGTQFATGETADLSGHDISPNQEISCEVTAEDPEGATGTEEASVTIANRDPEITSMLISDDTPEANAELNCSAQASDEDGSELTLSYVWTVDGNEVDFDEELTLIPENTPVDAVVRCSVSVDDGSGGEVTDYREAIVQNTPPEITTEAEITATGTITTVSTIGCSAEGADLNDGELTAGYIWTNMRTSNEIGTSALLSLNADLALPGDTVRCTAGVQDAQGEIATSIAVVTVNNAPPSFTQAAQITPNTGVYTGMELVCSALAEDPEEGMLTPTYNWEVNGSVVTGGTSFTLDASQTNVGDLITCRAEITDSDGDTDTSITSVTIENSAPIVNSVVLSIPDPEVEDLVECIPDITDVDDETLTITYSWEINGAPVPNETNPTLQLSTSLVSIGNGLTCNVEVIDGAGDTDSGSVIGTIQNTEPTITQAVITPDTGVDTISTLTCSATGDDVNDGPLSPTFTWMNGSTEIGTGASITLNSSLALPNDTVDCVAEVTDANGAITASLASVSVGNSLPIFTQPAEITPSTGIFTGTELSCFAASMDEEDGAINPTFIWEVEGVQVGIGPTYTISPDESDVGNTVTCVATVTDFHGGVRNSANTVTIENSEPNLVSMQILSNTGDVYNDSALFCEVIGEDADDDIVTVTYSWTYDGVEYSSANAINLTTTPLLPGDELTCAMEATDTHGASIQHSVFVTIANREPSDPTVSFSWLLDNYYPWPSEDITCVGAGSVDPDGQSVTYSYEWSSDAGGSFSGQVLPSSETSMDETWTCTVTASDGNVDTNVTAMASTLVRNCGLTDCDVALETGGGAALDFKLITDTVRAGGSFSVSSQYHIMTTEVTQAMFYQLMGYESYDGETTSDNTGSYGVGDDYPAYFVNWHMAADFANRVTNQHNALHGTSLSQCYSCPSSNSGTTSVYCEQAGDPYACDGYRLPTEVEWEIASRAGLSTGFWTADGGGGQSSSQGCLGTETIIDGASNPLVGDYAWYCGNNNKNGFDYGSKEVAQLLPNGFGLYDMHGNLSEWTEDYGGNGCPYPEASVDAHCDAASATRVSRGGGWGFGPQALNNSARAGYNSENRSFGFGFRLVRVP